MRDTLTLLSVSLNSLKARNQSSIGKAYALPAEVEGHPYCQRRDSGPCSFFNVLPQRASLRAQSM